ncbi:MAG: hypothetical protein ABSF62_06955 [Bryobacteraceae bacterium]
MSPEIAARLADLNIQLAAQARDYCLFVRGNCLALAQAAGESFTSIGASGMMTENGIAYLVWREGRPVLAAHGGHEQPATPEEVETVRHFSEDLKLTLGLAQ